MSEEPVLRADARLNRERILAAAEDVFLERGADASLEEVARRAKVGIGTLYRRFPSREMLLAATYNARLLSFVEASRARDADGDPLGAVRAYLAGLAMNTNIYRGLAVSLGTVLQSGTPGCHATTEEGHRLLRCGQQTGTIRRDVTFDDLVYVVTAISLAAELDDESQPRIAHLVDLFLDGISVR